MGNTIGAVAPPHGPPQSQELIPKFAQCMTSKTRGYCFTLNNYTDDEEQQLQQLGRQVQYLVYGRERGGEANTPHLQGYIHFNSPTSFNRAKELLPRAHVERRRGTIDQAIEYCKKIKMYMRKAEDRCLVKLEEPLDETSSSSSSSTHETETSTGLQNTIPNGSSPLLTAQGTQTTTTKNIGRGSYKRMVGWTYWLRQVKITLGTIPKSLPQATQQMVGWI